MTEVELEAIYREKKVVDGSSLEWKWENNAHRIQADVFLPNGEKLLLRAVNRHKYSFSLIYKGVWLIRRWDINKHKNNDGTRVSGPHKHKYTEDRGREYCYPVDDVCIDDAQQGLLDFLEECNIKVQGNINQQLLFFPQGD